MLAWRLTLNMERRLHACMAISSATLLFSSVINAVVGPLLKLLKPDFDIDSSLELPVPLLMLLGRQKSATKAADVPLPLRPLFVIEFFEPDVGGPPIPPFSMSSGRAGDSEGGRSLRMSPNLVISLSFCFLCLCTRKRAAKITTKVNPPTPPITLPIRAALDEGELEEGVSAEVADCNDGCGGLGEMEGGEGGEGGERGEGGEGGEGPRDIPEVVGDGIIDQLVMKSDP